MEDKTEYTTYETFKQVYELIKNDLNKYVVLDINYTSSIRLHYCNECGKLIVRNKNDGTLYICPHCCKKLNTNNYLSHLVETTLIKVSPFYNQNYVVFTKLKNGNLRINRFVGKLQCCNDFSKVNKNLSLEAYAILNFKTKEIVCKKLVKDKQKMKFEDCNLAFVFMINKAFAHKYYYEDTTALHFFTKYFDIGKISGIVNFLEYIDEYQKYIPANKITRKEDSNFLLIWYLLIYEKLPQIEFLIKSNLKNLIYSLILEESVTSISSKKVDSIIDVFSDLFNKNATNLRNTISLPSYIIETLIDYNSLNNISYKNWLNIYYSYNKINQLFKNDVYSMRNDLDIKESLTILQNKYKNFSKISKLINYLLKKEFKNMQSLKDYVFDYKLENFGKDVFDNFFKKLIDYQNRGLNLSFENYANLLQYNIDLVKEEKYYLSQINLHKKELENLNLFYKDVHINQQYNYYKNYDDNKYNNKFFEKICNTELKKIEQNLFNFNDFIKFHVDYLNGKMLLMENENIDETETYNLNDCFPKNLIDAHDSVHNAVQIKTNSHQEEMLYDWGTKLETHFSHYRLTIDKYKEYFNNSDLLVKFPKSLIDFEKEGQMQSNCILSYVSSYRDRNKIIAFVRRKSNPEKSYITVEYTLKGNLIQSKYAGNLPITNSKDYAFLDNLQSILLKR